MTILVVCCLIAAFVNAIAKDKAQVQSQSQAQAQEEE